MSEAGRDLPRLSRAAVEGGGARPVRLVHLGLGAFHRAHQAWYTHRADAGADPGAGWGIAAFTGRTPAAAEPLAAQEGLYTLLTRGPGGDEAEVVTSLTRALDGADTGAWCQYLADPAVGVLTLTVTEAGYHRSPTGGLDRSVERVAADLTALRGDPRAPVATAPARIAQGLLARYRSGGQPLAVASCDNLADNGAITRRVTLDACADVDADLAGWVEESVSFVSTMVDRITPATTEDDAATAARLTGRADLAPVVTEPFTEWVLAGDFPAGHPDWPAAGAGVVEDVTPFEQRKLWLLNAGHSLLAYAGSTRGHETVADAVGDPVCAGWLEALWDDASAYLTLPGEDVTQYRAALLERFSNSRIRHRLAQVATDGSQKVPLRVLPVIRRHRQDASMPTGEVVALAAWLAHLRGHGVPVADTGARDLLPRVSGPARGAVRAVLEVVAEDLADDGDLCAAVAECCAELEGASTR